MLISIAMILMGLFVFKDAFNSIFNHKSLSFSIWLIVVCIVTILVKFSLYLYTSNLAKKHNNLLIKANSKDHRNDCVITLCTLISSILTLNKVYWFDGLVGSVIAFWMIITSLKIFK